MAVDTTDVDLIRKTFENALAEGAADAATLLAELGWWELHGAEPRVAIAELFEAQGRLGRATSALDVVVAEAIGQTGTAAAVVHPLPGAWATPGRAGDCGALTFDGLVIGGLERADTLIVPFTYCGRLGVAVVDAAGVDAEPRRGLDPSLGLVAVRGAIGAAARFASDPVPGWDTVVSAARRALAHELCGLAESVLDRAAAYVTDRHQFGRPIAAFQTVRHRLTEVYVALAAAHSALDAAWITGHFLLADAAKVLAGRAALLAARHCLQVTGAIGFTEEYGLAARIRRIHVLDSLYGGADALQADIGARLLATRSAPRLHPLP